MESLSIVIINLFKKKSIGLLTGIPLKIHYMRSNPLIYNILFDQYFVSSDYIKAHESRLLLITYANIILKKTEKRERRKSRYIYFKGLSSRSNWNHPR